MRNVLFSTMLLSALALGACAGDRDAVTSTGWSQDRSSADVRSRANLLLPEVGQCYFGGTAQIRESHDLDVETWGGTNDSFEEGRYRATDDYSNDCTKVVGGS